MGDNLIHVSGSLTTMFPADGGQIQVNKSQYVQGARTISTSVLKDGNMFVLHFLEPIDEILSKEELEESNGKAGVETLLDKIKQEENVEEEGNKSVIEESEKEQRRHPKPFCDFSSFVAELSDGMVLALSGYGPSGSLKEKEPKESEDTVTGYLTADVGPPPQPTPSPQPKAGSPKARKRAEEEAKRIEEIQQQQEEERLRLEEEGNSRLVEEGRSWVRFLTGTEIFPLSHDQFTFHISIPSLKFSIFIHYYYYYHYYCYYYYYYYYYY